MTQYSNKPSVEFILESYKKTIKDWMSRTRGVFGWVDDLLCGTQWQYWVHCRWVSDWNKTGREKDAIDFLSEWLTEDNILRAFKDWEDWEKQNG
jgi:hypothetical protein